MSCRTMAHEVGHLFGLQHCIYFQCIMNGNNGNERTPLVCCPICLHKLRVGTKFDPQERFAELERFYAKHGWENYQEAMAQRLAVFRLHDRGIPFTVAQVVAKSGLVIRELAEKSSVKVGRAKFHDNVYIPLPPTVLRSESGESERILTSYGWVTRKKKGREFLKLVDS